jgi:AcrR family transcriptional regulator
MSLRERNRERTRQEIMASALKMFRDQGFDNVSVEMICEAAGVSRATFFNYFQQKEAIFMAVAEARLKFVRKFLSEHAKEPRSYKFQDVIDLFLGLAAENQREEKMVKYIFPQVLQRPICMEHAYTARMEFEKVLKEILIEIDKQGDRLNPNYSVDEIAGLMISIYFFTHLEWANLKDIPKNWLPEKLRTRLEMIAVGIFE